MDLIGIGRFLRARREALQPEDVGLRRGARRRATGLKREEVADLADMSADYLSRLERGSGPQPSDQIIRALARALRLSLDERDHLLLLAGHAVPARVGTDDHVSPGLMRILDRLTDTPAMVLGALGETLAQNPAGVALLGDQSRFSGPDRSAAYRWFTDPGERSIYAPVGHDRHSRMLVSQARTVAARLGPASDAARLISQLMTLSPEFAALWNEGEVGLRYSDEKLLMHPEVGELSVYCQIVLDPDSLQSLLVFTATPGSESAERLRLLGVVGSYVV
jgi:transcriptional regulator with XRE-family HTH domain